MSITPRVIPSEVPKFVDCHPQSICHPGLDPGSIQIDSHFRGNDNGFTLIELLVTVSIILVLSGASLATYLNYRDQREVEDDASAVAERLRTVQIKAAATEVPAGCGSGVTNYVATFGGTALSVSATCSGGGSVDVDSLDLTLVDSTFTNSGSITFQSRTINAQAVTMCLTGSANIYKVEVSQAANVSKPTKVASCP